MRLTFNNTSERTGDGSTHGPNESGQNHFELLPLDIQKLIFEYLYPLELARTAQVSKKWKTLSKTETEMWKKRLHPCPLSRKLLPILTEKGYFKIAGAVKNGLKLKLKP